MTCVLRFVDVKYLRPKREAFDAAAYNDVDPNIIEAAGKGVDRTSEDADGKDGSIGVGVQRVGSPA